MSRHTKTILDLEGNPNEPLLRMQDVTRIHGSGSTRVVAVDELEITVNRGELVAIMGPSGSGKSTLLNLAGGLDVPTHGTVKISGVNLAVASAAVRAEIRLRHVGYIFQYFNLIPALTAAENVSLPLELDGMPTREAHQNAVKSLAEVGLPELADRFPDDMSGGQAQRVAIARALVGKRDLVLADEPTGALDSHMGETVMSVLRSRISGGAGALLVTHEPRYAAWADRTIFLRDGQIIDSTGNDHAESLLEAKP